MAAEIIEIPRICRRERALKNAREILRDADLFPDSLLMESARWLRIWGTPDDWLEADAMLQAIRTKHRKPSPALVKRQKQMRSLEWSEAGVIAGALFVLAMIFNVFMTGG